MYDNTKYVAHLQTHKVKTTKPLMQESNFKFVFFFKSPIALQSVYETSVYEKDYLEGPLCA